MPTQDGKKKKPIFWPVMDIAEQPEPKPFCEDKNHRWEYWQMGEAKCSVCDKCVPALVAMRSMQFYLDKKSMALDNIVVMIDNHLAKKL